MRRGDIILIRNRAWISFVVRFFSGKWFSLAQFSHCCWYLGNDKIIDCSGFLGGCKINDLSFYKDLHKKAFRFTIFNNEEIEKLLEESKKMIGYFFDDKRLFKLAFLYLFKTDAILSCSPRGDNKIICTDPITIPLFKLHGLRLVDKPFGNISPEDMSHSEYLKEVTIEEETKISDFPKKETSYE